MKKRNDQKEMKKRPLLALLLIICYLLFILASCSEPSTEKSGEGYFTISLSASENMRAVYPPTNTSDLKFAAKFKDTASGAERTYTSDGSGSIQGKIDVGNYIVTMDVSLISDGSPYARGIAYDNPVAIGSGQNQVKAYAYDVKNSSPPVISAKPKDATYAIGATAAALTVTASVNDGGAISYQWYSNTTNSVSDATAISGATSPSYTPSTATPGTTWYYVVVTNTGTGKPTTISTVPVAFSSGTADNSFVATPTANPAEGAVLKGTEVTLATATEGAEIWYTTNNSAPAKNGTGSTKYTAKITINEAITIKAIAVKDGWNDSEILTAAYTLRPGGDSFSGTTWKAEYEFYGGRNSIYQYFYADSKLGEYGSYNWSYLNERSDSSYTFIIYRGNYTIADNKVVITLIECKQLNQDWVASSDPLPVEYKIVGNTLVRSEGDMVTLFYEYTDDGSDILFVKQN